VPRRRSELVSAACALCLLASSGCGTTLDSLGYDLPPEGGPPMLRPLAGPATYPNVFRDVLGKTDAEITAKIDAAFQQLFHGDPDTQAIYFANGSDQAYIRDILHGDIRSEGIGFGMLITVELDKRDEFDHLWNYAKANLEQTSGANRGYFSSSCDVGDSTATCIDPFGMETFVMALLLARDRWLGDGGADTYGADAAALLDVMRHKQDENGGIVDGVTNVFDATTHLVFDVPNQSAAGVARPSVEMPAFYVLWAQATGDAFYSDLASAARSYYQAAAQATTGLIPLRATFGGQPVSGSENFVPEAYRVELDMTLDSVWTGTQAWEVAEANRLLAFFAAQGIDTYCGVYALDGTCVDSARQPGLVAMNGVSAVIATSSDRTAFIDAVWNLAIETGTPRYYSGVLELLALLVMSGRFQVY
jgi:oligosaccharide reducing-end xylanase